MKAVIDSTLLYKHVKRCMVVYSTKNKASQELFATINERAMLMLMLMSGDGDTTVTSVIKLESKTSFSFKVDAKDLVEALRGISHQPITLIKESATLRILMENNIVEITIPLINPTI